MLKTKPIFQTMRKHLEEFAVSQNGNCIDVIENPSEDLKMMAVIRSPSAIGRINEPSKTLQDIAVKKDVTVLWQIMNLYPSVFFKSFFRCPFKTLYWLFPHF